MNGNRRIVSSKRMAICLGPVPLSEEEDYGSYSESKKIEILRKFARAINKRERALWIAAEQLSNFGEGHGEIYSNLLKAAEE